MISEHEKGMTYWPLANLKRVREQNGETQEETAEALGLSVSTYRNWEQGKNNPTKKNLAALVLHFKCTIDDLVLVGSEPGNPRYEMQDVEFYRADELMKDTCIWSDDPDKMHGEFRPVPMPVFNLHPGGILLEVGDNLVDKQLPRGHWAYIDVSDNDNPDGGLYAVCINGNSAVVRHVRKLSRGYEVSPDSFSDPTGKPEVYDEDVDGTPSVTVIGRKVWSMEPVDTQ